MASGTRRKADRLTTAGNRAVLRAIRAMMVRRSGSGPAEAPLLSGGPATSEAKGRPVIFLHPGFARTATTTLQYHVLSRHPGLRYLGRPGPTPELDAGLAELCNADSAYFDDARVARLFRSAAAEDARPVVISNENFSLYKSKDKGLIARRLHAIFPEARVFFTLRRQEDLVASFYLTKLRKYLKGSNYLSFDEWFDIKRRSLHRSIFDDVRFFDIIECWAALFGRDRVRLFLYEDLRADPEGYARAMAGYLGVDAALFHALLSQRRDNAAMSIRYLATMRLAGRLLPRRWVRNLSHRLGRAGRPVKVEIGEGPRALIAEVCGEGNRRLQETYGVDLAGHGYTLDRPPTPAALGGVVRGSPGQARG